MKHSTASLLLLNYVLATMRVSAFVPSIAQKRPPCTCDQQSGALFAQSATSTAEPTDLAEFLLSNSSMAEFMPKWPAIVTYTAVKGWTDDTSRWMQRAVQDVLDLNPILTGRVYQRQKHSLLSASRRCHHFGGTRQLRVAPGYFGEEHNFVEIVAAPDGMTSLDGMNCTSCMRHLQQVVIPSMQIRCGSTEEDIRHALPLFQIKVHRFKDDTACIGMKMSHCLGDGLTFFYLFDQIMYYMNKEAQKDKEDGLLSITNTTTGTDLQLRKIDWNHRAKASFECYPHTFSAGDRRNAYGWPFYVGIFRNIRRLFHPSYKRLMVLSRDKIDTVKQAYLKTTAAANGTERMRISANDLITAGLCQSCQSTDIFSFPFNQRGRRADLLDATMAGGYLCSEIPVLRRAAVEPRQVRQIVQQGQYFGRNQVPRAPFVQGRNGRISNFASVQTKNLFLDDASSGLQVVCHCMPVNFFDIFPIDVAMIFPVDKKHIGVMHNFDKFRDDVELLNDMVIFEMSPEEEDALGRR